MRLKLELDGAIDPPHFDAEDSFMDLFGAIGTAVEVGEKNVFSITIGGKVVVKDTYTDLGIFLENLDELYAWVNTDEHEFKFDFYESIEFPSLTFNRLNSDEISVDYNGEESETIAKAELLDELQSFLTSFDRYVQMHFESILSLENYIEWRNLFDDLVKRK